VTRLEQFLKNRKIRPAHLARESGYSRQHLLRVRTGRMEPTRRCIAAIVTAACALSKGDVRPEELFELSLHESGAWERQQELTRKAAVDRKRALDAAQRLIHRLERENVPVTKWFAELESANALTEPMVVVLVERSRALTQGEPRRAEKVQQLAIKVAERLPHDTAAVVSVHGRAYMCRGNALANLSEYDAAFHAFDAAEAILTESSQCIRELGQVWYSRARTLVRRNAYEEAKQWLRRASVIFGFVHDDRMAGLTRLLEGAVLYEIGDAAAAERVLRGTLDLLGRTGDKAALASAWLNIGRCDIELGETKAARVWLEKARVSFAKQGARAEVARARWCLAWLRALYEDRSSGLDLLWEARRSFEQMEMPTDAALVGVDIVEVLLIGETPDGAAIAADVCRSIIDTFQARGETANVRRALAYLREALRQGGTDRTLVHDVRRYVKRWSNDPTTVFEPASSEHA